MTQTHWKIVLWKIHSFLDTLSFSGFSSSYIQVHLSYSNTNHHATRLPPLLPFGHSLVSAPRVTPSIQEPPLSMPSQPTLAKYSPLCDMPSCRTIPVAGKLSSALIHPSPASRRQTTSPSASLSGHLCSPASVEASHLATYLIFMRMTRF